MASVTTSSSCEDVTGLEYICTPALESGSYMLKGNESVVIVYGRHSLAFIQDLSYNLIYPKSNCTQIIQGKAHHNVWNKFKASVIMVNYKVNSFQQHINRKEPKRCFFSGSCEPLRLIRCNRYRGI